MGWLTETDIIYLYLSLPVYWLMSMDFIDLIF